MTQSLPNDIEDLTEEEFIDSIGENDFVLILTEDGNLKTFLMPETYKDADLPENISKIFKLLNVNNLESRTLH
jgi:hypothetical protein